METRLEYCSTCKGITEHTVDIFSAEKFDKDFRYTRDLWSAFTSFEPIEISCCKQNCGDVIIKYGDKTIYPENNAIKPNEAMPEHIKSVYNEASCIRSKSPRSAAALLRLCLEEICIYVGASGKDLNSKIKDMIHNKGLPNEMEKGLHNVRIIGNKAIHAGDIIKDVLQDDENVATIFNIVNEIVHYTIEEPERKNKLYSLIENNK